MRLDLILVAFLAGLLCGCQSGAEPFSSNDVPELSAPAAGAIAGDLSGRFAEQAGSISKSLKLRGNETGFAMVLETALKGWGYKMAGGDNPSADKNDPKSLELTYSLARGDGQVLARLSTDTITVSRIYSVTATGATPASPLSLMKRN
jgi:hypothetical protein